MLIIMWINIEKRFPPSLCSSPLDWHTQSRSVCLYFEHSYIPPHVISLCIVWEVLKCCFWVWVSFRRDDISAGECLKSLDIMEREQPFVLLVLLFIGATDSCLPFSLFRLQSLSRSLASSLFLTQGLSCFVRNRHTYAQFVLWWLQARAVC